MLRLHTPWKDFKTEASPLGAQNNLLTRILAAPLLRDYSARIFQPIVQFGEFSKDVITLYFVQTGFKDGNLRYETIFTASKNGEAFIYLNDALMPFLWGYKADMFYQNNDGFADIELMELVR